MLKLYTNEHGSRMEHNLRSEEEIDHPGVTNDTYSDNRYKCRLVYLDGRYFLQISSYVPCYTHVLAIDHN